MNEIEGEKDSNNSFLIKIIGFGVLVVIIFVCLLSYVLYSRSKLNKDIQTLISFTNQLESINAKQEQEK